jgi:hypothetical protein
MASAGVELKKIIFILFVANVSWAACPLYQYRQDPQLNQEIQNICSNISNPKQNSATANAITMNGPFQSNGLTLAQLKALTPSGLGQQYFCSDCATDLICASSGTSRGAFVRVSSRGTVCQ